MADKSELSLQSLYKLIANKADKTHTHSFIGSIESALSLNGVTYDKFVRNDLKDQVIKSYYDSVTFGVASNNTSIVLKAENNRSRMVVDNENLDTNNLIVSGPNDEDVVVKVVGSLLVNDGKVLTVNDKNQISGVDFTDVDINGKGIVVDPYEPTKLFDGLVWGKVIDEDLVLDDTAIANNTLYTVPVGSLIRMLSNVVPNGYLRADGHTVSRTGYANLWEFVKSKSILVTDEQWQTEFKQDPNVEKYSYGDGSITFRLPNLVTNDNTIYAIKSYDDLSTKDVANLEQLQKKVEELESSKVVSGYGFFKFFDGGLIQYGVTTGTTCNFSIPFIDTSYAISPNYEGTNKNVDITINNVTKATNKCELIVTNSAGVALNNSTINYTAIGRWK